MNKLQTKIKILKLCIALLACVRCDWFKKKKPFKTCLLLFKLYKIATILKRLKRFRPYNKFDWDFVLKNLCAKFGWERSKRMVAIAVTQTNNFFNIPKSLIQVATSWWLYLTPLVLQASRSTVHGWDIPDQCAPA